MLDSQETAQAIYDYLLHSFFLPSLSACLFSLTLISDLHYIKSVKHIPYFGFSNLLRRLAYITLWVSLREIRVCSLMDTVNVLNLPW